MNWDAIGAIAELLAAIGVVASLIYLATQIRHSREQTQQNTKAIEAQVAWAHFGATRDIYFSRISSSKRVELANAMLIWDQASLPEVEKQHSGDFAQAIYLVATEFGYWQSRYVTQTSDEEREILANHIKINGGPAIYRAYWNRATNGQVFYRSEFTAFVDEIFSQLDAN